MTDQYRRSLDAELSGLGLTSAGDPELRVLSNIAWAIRRSLFWILCLGFMAAVVSYVLTYLSVSKYTSNAKVMIETRVQTETEFTPQVSGLPLSLTSLESELVLLRSTDLIETVVDRLELQNDPEFSGQGEAISLSPIDLARGLKDQLVAYLVEEDNDLTTGGEGQPELDLTRETTIKNLQDSRSIEQIGDLSAVYEIRVTSESPQKAALIANSLASEYMTLLTKMKRDDLVQSQQWLATRIGQIREDLNTLSSDLEAHSIDTPFTPDEYATIKAQRIKAEKRAALVGDELFQIDGKLKTLRFLKSNDQLIEAVEFATETGLMSQVPGKALDSKESVAVLEDAQNAAERRSDVLKGQLAALNLTIENFKEQQVRQVQHDSVTKRIENEILVAEAIYRDFVSQLGRRAEQGEYLDAGAHIIETARVPVEPSQPRRSVTALMVMFAVVFLGLAYVALRELFQKRLRTTYELENATGIKLSAIVPEMKRNRPFETFFTKNGKIDSQLLHYGRKLLANADFGLRTLRQDGELSTSQAAEFFSKSLDIKSNHRAPENGCMIFSGATALADEGKTSTLLLLGAVGAQAGYRTLIVDCDTVTSTYRDLSQITEESLKYAANHPLSLQDFIVGTPQDGLDVLPLVGTQKDTKLIKSVEDFLCSQAFLNLLHGLADSYEVILLDTPPLLQAVESAYLSQVSQRVILFTRWNKTDRNYVMQAMRELENAGVRPAALVATRVDMKQIKKYGDPLMA
jgi:uncharacterized protein involved in exopolysaccharide biosynthesis/Mrp family chromosome partitioning ATPase